MISLNQIIAQKNSIPKIKDILAGCEANDFDSSNDDGVIHQMMHQLRNLDFSKKMKRKMVYTLMDIDYLQIVPHIIDRNQEALEKGIKNVDVSYFEGNNKEMFEDSLVNYLTETFPNEKSSSSTCLYATIAMMMKRRTDTQLMARVPLWFHA